MKGWIDLGSDSSWEDYGGEWGRKARDGAWYVLRFDNLLDAMGDEAPCKYSCDVLRVNLAEISEKEIKSALSCVGLDLENVEPKYREQATVEACVSYGVYAPLDTIEGDTYPTRIRAEARRTAERYMRDSDALESALDRPVNAIGSTARDFGHGDILAGLHRYANDVASGQNPGDNASNNFMLKMYGCDSDALKKVDGWTRLAKDDPIAFMMGFMHGEQRGEIESGEDFAEAYMAGQEWGVIAKSGRLPWPTWIKKGV